MKLTDTLDQILRMLLTTDGADEPEPAPAREEARRHETAAAAERLSADLTQEAARVGAQTQSQPIAEPVATPLPVAETPRKTSEEPAPQDSPAAAATLETTADLVERLGVGFHLGAAIERIATAAGEGTEGAGHLREATWLIERYLELLERRPVGADLHLTMMRLAREGDTIAGLQALAAALQERQARALPEEPEEQEPAEEPSSPAVAPELPSVRRELIVMTARTAIVIVAVVMVVVVLTLIAQWR
jgi:hypothetical protein